MSRTEGMGGHQSGAMGSDVWLTPPFVLAALGPFDLDPCACPEPRPWPTAAVHYTRDDNGLMKPWRGRVWLNPPYGGRAILGPWMRRMADHGRGCALIFARTETEIFHRTVWQAADAILFFRGRLFFHRQDGKAANANAGAPSCLIAYSQEDAAALRSSTLPGHIVTLRGD